MVSLRTISNYTLQISKAKSDKNGFEQTEVMCVCVCVCVCLCMYVCSSMSQWLMGLESDTQSWQTKETTSSYHLSAQSAGTNKWSYWRRRDRPSRTDYIFTLRMKQYTAHRHLTHTRPDKYFIDLRDTQYTYIQFYYLAVILLTSLIWNLTVF